MSARVGTCQMLQTCLSLCEDQKQMVINIVWLQHHHPHLLQPLGVIQNPSLKNTSFLRLWVSLMFKALDRLSWSSLSGAAHNLFQPPLTSIFRLGLERVHFF